MPAGVEVRLARGRLDIPLPAAAALCHVEAFCRIRRGDGVEESAGREWTRTPQGLATVCGPLELTLETAGDGGVLELRLRGRSRQRVDIEEIGLRAGLLVDEGAPAHLVQSGYQSWDPATLLPLDPGRPTQPSWWTAGLVGSAGGAIGIAARSAVRHATRIDWSGDRVGVAHARPPGLGGRGPVWRARSGATFVGEKLAITAATEVGQALARAAGSKRSRRRRPPRGWLSWYHHGPWVGRAEIEESSSALTAKPYSELGLDVVQIDDGWQMAYGDWTPNTKFQPLESLTAEVRGRGQVPGVWTAPFLVSAGSDLWHAAPKDWFIRDPATGAPAVDPRHLVFGPMHVLDARRSEVRRHLEQVFRSLRESGFGYFKIDFLYAGAYAGAAALRAGVRAIRRGIGPDAYLLACGAPLLPLAGLADGCRIGPDTCTPLYDFESGTSQPTFFGDEVKAVARAVAFRRHLAGWFDLDPDVALAARTLSPGAARQLVSVVALAGGLYFLSDALAALPADRRGLVANPEIVALAGNGPADADWVDGSPQAPPSRWHGPDGTEAFFNWGAEPERHLLETAHATVRDLWQRVDLAPDRGVLELEVPPGDVRVVRPGRG